MNSLSLKMPEWLIEGIKYIAARKATPHHVLIRLWIAERYQQELNLLPQKKREAQENDKDKLFTVQEIRSQLQNTMIKMTSLDYIHSGIYEVDLFGALSYRLLRDAGFSDKYIKSLDKEVNKK